MCHINAQAPESSVVTSGFGHLLHLGPSVLVCIYTYKRIFHITDATGPAENLEVDKDTLDKQLAQFGRIDVSIQRSLFGLCGPLKKTSRTIKGTQEIHKRLLTQSLSHTFK